MTKFDEILNKAKAAAGVAGKKTEEMLETSKLKLQVVQINSDIDKIYKRIGELMYSQSRNNISASAEIEDAMNQIDKLYQDATDINAKISEMQKFIKCSNCGAANSMDAIFCSRCGRTLSKENEQTKSEKSQSYVNIIYEEANSNENDEEEKFEEYVQE